MRSDLNTTGFEKQRGAALAVSLVLLLPISLVAVSGMQSRNLEQRMASNFQQHLQAQSLAESGIKDALDLLEQPCGVDDGFDDQLQSNGGVLLNNISLGHGTYSVSAVNNGVELPSTSDSDGTIVLSSTGQVANLSVTVEQVVSQSGTNTIYAVLANGNLGMDGSPSLNGCLVNVHANGDVNILGGGQMAGQVSATGTVINSGATIEGGTESTASPVSVPNIDPTALSSSATYTLDAPGQVLDGDGNVLWDGTGTDWNGWQFLAGDWTLTTDTAPVGVYYVEGTAVIDGNPGSTGSPWSATIVAEQNVIVTGDVQMASYDSSLQIGDLRNLALVSGGDLQINGTADQSFEGTLAAAEQIELTGDPTIDGSIVAENDGTTSSLVTDNLISGDMTITNGQAGPLTDDVEVEPLAWRTVGN